MKHIAVGVKLPICIIFALTRSATVFRRVCFGACLTLSYKFNELSGQRTSKLQALLDFIDRDWYTSNKQVRAASLDPYRPVKDARRAELNNQLAQVEYVTKV
jgi:hypothetical protein